MHKDEELRDDPPASGTFPLPLHPEAARLERVYSGNRPEVGQALAALREAAGDSFLVGEVYLGTSEYGPYLEHLDLVFAFELFHSLWDADRLRRAIAAAVPLGRVAWVLSNHDFPRLPTRFGRENERAAATLLLTLPGTAFVYQGDEIGLTDGPGADPPFDRAGRDGARHPMQWNPGAHGGFTTGQPWLPTLDPGKRNVADQARDPDSLLQFYRRLIELRKELGCDFGLLESAPEVLAYRRGTRTVAINLSSGPRPAPVDGYADLAPHASAILGE